MKKACVLLLLLLFLPAWLYAATPGRLMVGWTAPTLDTDGNPVGALKLYRITMRDGATVAAPVVLEVFVAATRTDIQLRNLDLYLSTGDAFFEVYCTDAEDRESLPLGGYYDVGSIGAVGAAPAMQGVLIFDETT